MESNSVSAAELSRVEEALRLLPSTCRGICCEVRAGPASARSCTAAPEVRGFALLVLLVSVLDAGVSSSMLFGAERTVLEGAEGSCGVDGSSEVNGVDSGGRWGCWSATATCCRKPIPATVKMGIRII
jgi:hypothetical protein